MMVMMLVLQMTVMYVLMTIMTRVQQESVKSKNYTTLVFSWVLRLI